MLLTSAESQRYTIMQIERSLRESAGQAAADALCDAIWQYNENDPAKQGRWEGVGLGRIPAHEIIEYVIELEEK